MNKFLGLVVLILGSLLCIWLYKYIGYAVGLAFVVVLFISGKISMD